MLFGPASRRSAAARTDARVTETAPPPDSTAAARAPIRPAGWALGLPALALLCLVAILRHGPAIERDIRRAALQGAGHAADSPFARHRARAEVDGRDVTVVADLGMPDELRSAVDAIARLPGVRAVRTMTAVPRELHPFRLTITRGPQGFVLAGGVASADDRAALVAEAARFVGEDLVEDRLALATGAPPGFGAVARLAVAMLGPLESGDVELSDTLLDLRGRAPDPARYDAALAALRQLPAGYRVGARDLVPPSVDVFTWTAERRGDEVLLAGNVPSEALRARIADMAAAALPGLAVRDRMQTARGLSRRVDLAASVQAGLAGLAALQAGRVELVDRHMTFRGETAARAEAGAIAARMRASLPAGTEAGAVDITVVPASPFLFTAVRAGGRVVLSGHVPDAAERRGFASLVAARFPGERLVDRLVVADGAPGGFAEVARVAVETLGELADGEAAIRDRSLRVEGRVLYGQLAARLRRGVPRAVPPEWTASVALEPPLPEQAVDAILCGDLLADAARRAPIRFPDERSAALPAGPAVEAVAAIVRRCGRAEIRIVHEIASREPPEAARGLADQRAKAIVAALEARNVTARLSGEGAVLRPPDAPAPALERTEFRVGAAPSPTP